MLHSISNIATIQFVLHYGCSNFSIQILLLSHLKFEISLVIIRIQSLKLLLLHRNCNSFHIEIGN